ncbi:uncharacterized protein EV422DRAFT_510524 [Fimicolochytrium jonesii]|uniref:uncharacterized protein n=1 Tax=Fimicolochytrium jonesii TaxID=1396493 RepID=UPI0022FE2498|nr:uncharacterized protein EV422DRAFT_510524 [Fimicolochytrium jonesii]KAI8815526.1 hypothetical protein EV422DRAFT_510524 [Fimicolochytrium jonesii]
MWEKEKDAGFLLTFLSTIRQLHGLLNYPPTARNRSMSFFQVLSTVVMALWMALPRSIRYFLWIFVICLGFVPSTGCFVLACCQAELIWSKCLPFGVTPLTIVWTSFEVGTVWRQFRHPVVAGCPVTKRSLLWYSAKTIYYVAETIYYGMQTDDHFHLEKWFNISGFCLAFVTLLISIVICNTKPPRVVVGNNDV